MPFPLLAAIPALLGGLGGAGGIMGALGGAGGIMGMIGKILPFGDMIGGMVKNLFSSDSQDSEAKQDQAKGAGAKAKQDANSFLARQAKGDAAPPQPLTLLNLFS